VTTTALLARDITIVKSVILDEVSIEFYRLFQSAEAGTSPRMLELDLWKLLLDVGQIVLAVLFATLCRRATEADLRVRGLDPSRASLRLDEDYWNTLMTTVGPVRFPVFAYRDRSMGVSSTTRAPAREQVFPLHRHCRSSELCLEWEAKLGSEHPFRTAQAALTYFTHGAVKLEDNTIARHMVVVGSMVDPDWLYRPKNQIRELLRTRATRNAETNQPIIYASSDAHALRRYVDDTWAAPWKMANGLRLWCVDWRTGAVIHLGGEFTWGDCHEVHRIIQRLIASGHLPTDGDYGDGVVASIAWVVDGMPWFKDYILSLYPDALNILDAYHAKEKIGKLGAALFGKGSKKARAFYATARKALLGTRRRPACKPKPRKGHKKRARAKTWALKQDADRRRVRKLTTAAEPLLKVLRELNVPQDKVDLRGDLIHYVENNAYRMDYSRYQQLGYQIGSGAMESLHRVASQLRMKRPGPGWLPETAQAIFNLRMLALVGRWDEFWNQPDLEHHLSEAFRVVPGVHS